MSRSNGLRQDVLAPDEDEGERTEPRCCCDRWFDHFGLLPEECKLSSLV